ncbi:MAG: acetolactate synthase large subunit [Pseudomonadota bacterium]
MNGAESLLQTLLRDEVTVCFANPGTSEMHFVAALERTPEMRGVLCLFEGVATGAADGYGRIAGKPAVTLLHLGPGFGNGWANLHNARRSGAPLINVIGDHATWHRELDAPLTSDVEGLAKTVSAWVGTAEEADEVAAVTAQAVAASRSFGGQIASMILPADAAWNAAEGAASPLAPSLKQAPDAAIDAAAKTLKAGAKPVLLVGRNGLYGNGLKACARIAAATQALVCCDTFAPRFERGAGRFELARLPYFGELIVDFLKDTDEMVVAGTKPPVSFFAYPETESHLTPPGVSPVRLAFPDEDVAEALTRLADALDAPAYADIAGDQEKSLALPELIEEGPLTTDALGRALARFLPANAIISDEAITSGLESYIYTASAEPHDWMSVCGGAIGQGLPVGIGAAVAAPDRKVVCLQADGSAMYTVQSLWTMAREKLDVTTVLLSNRAYSILNIELQRVGVEAIPNRMPDLFSLRDPDICWADLAQSMGVEAVRCETAEAFNGAIAEYLSRPGPTLIEAVLPG